MNTFTTFINERCKLNKINTTGPTI